MRLELDLTDYQKKVLRTLLAIDLERTERESTSDAPLVGGELDLATAIREILSQVDSQADLQPLLDRNRYTDEEWKYASSGRCGWVVATYPSLQHCNQPSDPDSFYRYCTEHDREARDDTPNYGT